MSVELKGLWCPVATPFLADGSVALDLLTAHSQQLLADGATGLAVLGTTSEANSLTVDERRRVIDAHLEAGIPADRLMPGTGGCAIDDVVVLSRHAAEAGAAAVLMLPPFYYKNVPDDGLFAFAAAVIERLGGAVPRILLYHFPQMAVIGWSLPLIARLIDAFPEVVVGIKDSSGDKANTLAIIDAHPGFAVFPGTEVFQLEAMARGAAGAITVSGNINAATIAALCSDWQGAEAERRQAAANELRKAIQGPQQIPRIKTILAERTGAADWRNVRPPLVPLTEEERTALLAEPAVMQLLAGTTV